MPTLTQADYGEPYWNDGTEFGYSEPPRRCFGVHDPNAYGIAGYTPTGEYLHDEVLRYVIRYQLAGKTLLELGSGYGFMVADMRALGVNAWGCEWSDYAYSQCDPAIQPFIYREDARTLLPTFKNNQWAVIVSKDFLPCLDPADLPALITSMNRKSQQQVHIIGETPNPTWYIQQPLEWWATQGFAVGTRLVSLANEMRIVVV